MESLRYRMEAIKTVNDRLSSPEEAVRDGTICIIAGTTTYEVLFQKSCWWSRYWWVVWNLQATNGTKLGILTHIKGLQQLIDMRGGLRSGSIPLILQRVVAWYVWFHYPNHPSLYLKRRLRVDLTSANILQSTPHFPEFELVNVPPPASWPFTHLNPLSTTRHPNPTLRTTSLTTFDSNLQDIFTDLWKFPTSEKNPEMIDHIWYSDKIYLLQRSLMDIAYNKQHNTSHIDRACAIAALIYLHTGLCEVGIRSKVISVLVSRFKSWAADGDERICAWRG
jgi:hypothetical protein